MKLIWKYNSINYLSFGKLRISGRNNTGKITQYHRGGGCKRKYRLIDYKKNIWNIFGIVVRLEYDPNRSSILALVAYSNGILVYMISPEGLRVGERLMSLDSYENTILPVGYTTYLKNIPVGVKINNIELMPGKGSVIARAAGTFATIITKTINYVILKLKSGEIRKVHNGCIATFGVVSNYEHIYKKFRKAGNTRLIGWRPHVRGVAMNPIDHPHGGGQGKTSGGRPSVSFTGKLTKGVPTRKKLSSMVIKNRRKN